MANPSSSMRDLARRLLAASRPASGLDVHEALLVSDKLRNSLIRFAGADGFVSLQRRALKLASAEAPALQSVKIGADGRLDGLERLAAESGPGKGAGEPAVAITAHLLGLLVTFIGEPLTLKLVREAWPDTASVASQPGASQPGESQPGESNSTRETRS